MRCVGGPLDGQAIETQAHLVTVEGTPGRYVRWYDIPDHDPDWWGLPEPVMPGRYLRWQGPGEYSDNPGVTAIREALRAAR